MIQPGRREIIQADRPRLDPSGGTTSTIFETFNPRCSIISKSITSFYTLCLTTLGAGT